MLVAEKPLKTYLQKYFGFDKFKGKQEEIITNLLAGNDTFVIMPTGGGKSMCYQLPSLILEGYCNCCFAFDCLDEKPGGCDAWL